MRTLVAGVGYHNLSDLSVGPMLVPKLKQMTWSPNVEIEDLSFGAIAVMQRLQDRPGYFDRAIFVAAVRRGREPGCVYSYRWDGALPDVEEIQRRVGEAVTGIISLDNLLIITRYFGVLPADVRVVEIEPENTESGLDFTPRVQASMSQVIEQVKQMVNGN